HGAISDHPHGLLERDVHGRPLNHLTAEERHTHCDRGSEVEAYQPLAALFPGRQDSGATEGKHVLDLPFNRRNLQLAEHVVPHRAIQAATTIPPCSRTPSRLRVPNVHVPLCCSGRSGVASANLSIWARKLSIPKYSPTMSNTSPCRPHPKQCQWLSSG